MYILYRKRIDLAVNLVNPMNLDGLMLYTKNHKGMQRSSWSESGHTNGISWGKSGSQGVRLSVYEKWKSPNARFAIKKFGTSQFYRMEYNIGRKHLTRVENVYNVKDFSSYSDDITYKYPQRLDTCSDLCETLVSSVWERMIFMRFPSFDADEMLVDHDKIDILDIDLDDCNNYNERAMKQITGYLKKFSKSEDIVKQVTDYFQPFISNGVKLVN